ncbi:ATP-binding cassette domain-containing protein [Bengtsoniella intestinalis]|uniref:ATP-binding cassette domain-containing protein n=1 Tax=Bengtsoniella intestinalis TaxID=3073143 RepID=UPI00391EFE5D
MIELKNLSKTYGEQVVLDDVSIILPSGKLTCLLGPSGKGKTTLLRILMGLETADAGTITGLEGLQKSAVFQEDRLCEGLNLYINILLPHLQKGSDLTLSQIKTALQALDLEGNEGKLVRDLSGGMKRRVAILRALLAPYDILFLDEPFKGLDGKTKEKTMDYFKEKARGKTVLCITHDEAEVAYLKPEMIVRL